MTTPPATQKDWMHSLADFMIQNPHSTNVATARVFGVSAVWIGVVKRSDSFRELMKKRRAKHAEMVSQTVIEKVEALAEQAIDELSFRMQTEVVPLETVKDIGDMALKSLGFGGRNSSSSPVVNNITVTVEKEALAAAREKMKLINGGNAAVISPPSSEETSSNAPLPLLALPGISSSS